MFIDASALTAMLTDENEARELLARLHQAAARLTSPLAVWEAAIAVARVLGLPISEANEAVESYLALMEIKMCKCHPKRLGSRSTRLIVTARAGTWHGSISGTALPTHAPAI